ncbi:MAG: hypothetical protein RLZZ15_3486, partial [Verrucomicrobiota bacterium]
NFYFLKCSPLRAGGFGWDAITPHHGIVARVSADGKKFDVFAHGARAPNGLAIGPDDRLSVSDNEGDWVPTSRLSFVREGDFLGVPELAHGPRPTDYGRPALWLPHDKVDNSSGGQAWVPAGGRWGPFGESLLHLSYGRAALFLVMDEEIGGVRQAGAVRFPLKFESGIMRARFNPADGQLYVCGFKGWQGDARRDGALQRVRYTGKPVALPTALHVKTGRIEITFAQPLDPKAAADAANFAVERWTYQWTKAYGSPEFSVARPGEKGHDPVEVRGAQLLADGRTVALDIPSLAPVMQMKIGVAIRALDGTPIECEIFNTIARVP